MLASAAVVSAAPGVGSAAEIDFILEECIDGVLHVVNTSGFDGFGLPESEFLVASRAEVPFPGGESFPVLAEEGFQIGIADHDADCEPAGNLTSAAPARLLETRSGEKTVDGLFEGIGRRGSESVSELVVAGRSRVPIDAEAMRLNLTAVLPDAAGFLTAYPCGEARPVTSNVNSAPGDVVPNAVLAEIGTDGKVCISTLAATDVLADVNGLVPAHGSPLEVWRTRPTGAPGRETGLRPSAATGRPASNGWPVAADAREAARSRVRAPRKRSPTRPAQVRIDTDHHAHGIGTFHSMKEPR